MTTQKFPFTLDPLHPKEVAEYKKDFGGHYVDLVQVNPGQVIMQKAYENFAEKIYNFPMRSDDVWVLGMRKTGTTWLQEAVWCLLHDVDLDAATSADTYGRVCVPEADMNREMFETSLKYFEKEGNDADMGIIERIKDMHDSEKFTSPRTIKCHFALHLLPPSLLDTSKVIYIARNPKDTCVSSYYNTMNFNYGREDMPFETYAKWYFRNRIEGAPYWRHVEEAWSKRNHPNMLFLKYEDMKENTRATVHQMAHFLGKQLSEKQISDLVAHLAFKRMRENPATNKDNLKGIGLYKKDRHFIRKGIVGDWLNHTNPELDKTVDEWCIRERGTCTLHFPGVPLPSKF